MYPTCISSLKPLGLKGQPLGANFAAGSSLWDLHRRICRKTPFPSASRRLSLPLALVYPVKSSRLQGLSGKAVQLPDNEETFQTYRKLLSSTSLTFLPPPPLQVIFGTEREKTKVGFQAGQNSPPCISRGLAQLDAG